MRHLMQTKNIRFYQLAIFSFQFSLFFIFVIESQRLSCLSMQFICECHIACLHVDDDDDTDAAADDDDNDK